MLTGQGKEVCSKPTLWVCMAKQVLDLGVVTGETAHLPAKATISQGSHSSVVGASFRLMHGTVQDTDI